MQKTNDNSWLDCERSPLFRGTGWDNWERRCDADDSGQAMSLDICAGVMVMPATPAAQVREETTQSAEAAETATPSQTGRDEPAAKEEKLTTPGMLAGAVAAATDEERRASRKADHQARLAGKSHPSGTIGCHEAASAVIGSTAKEAVARRGRCPKKQLEKSEVLLRLSEDCLVPTEVYLMKAELHLRSAKEHLEAAEAQLAPIEASLLSTDKAIVGAPNTGEPAEGHWRQGA